MKAANRPAYSLTGMALILVIGIGIGLGAGHLWTKRQRADSAAASNPESAGHKLKAPGSASSPSKKESASHTESTLQAGVAGRDYVEEVFLKVQNGTWNGCVHAWREVMRDLDPNSIPALLARAETLRDSDKHSARSALLGRWAESDPSAALAAAGRMSNPRERDAAESAIYSAWAGRDFDAALAAINRLPEGRRRNELLDSITEAAAQSNPERAFAFLISRQMSSPSLRFRLSGICEQWARKNPQAAIQAMAGRSSAIRREMAEGIASGWAENDSSAAMTWASSLPGFQERKAATSAVVSSLDESNPGLLTSILDGISDQGLRNELIPGIARKLASNNPHEAAAWCEQMPEGSAKLHAMNAIVSSWSREDPAAAARYVLEKTPGENHQSLLVQVLREWSNDDSKAASAFLGSVQDPKLRSELTTTFVAHLAETDPDAALKMAEGLSGADKDQAMTQIISQLGREDVTRAMQLVQKLPEGDSRESAITSLSWQLQQEDPQAGLKLVSSLAEGPMKSSLVSQMIASLAQTDTASALAALKEITNPTTRSAALGALINRWSAQSPSEAFAYVQSLPATEQTPDVMRIMALSLSRQSLESASAKIAQIPEGEARTAYMQGIGEALARKSPEEAARFVAAMPAGDAQNQLAARVVGSLAAKDPRSAADWVSSFPAGEARTDSIRSLLSVWANKSPNDATQWAAQLTGTDRDSAAFVMASTLAWRSPEKAAGWATQVADQDRRQRLIRIVASTWSRSDKAAAQKWVGSLGLSDEQQQKMLKPVGRGYDESWMYIDE